MGTDERTGKIKNAVNIRAAPTLLNTVSLAHSSFLHFGTLWSRQAKF